MKIPHSDFTLAATRSFRRRADKIHFRSRELPLALLAPRLAVSFDAPFKKTTNVIAFLVDFLKGRAFTPPFIHIVQRARDFSSPFAKG